MGGDAAKIAEEVLQHLTGLPGTKAEITLETQTELEDGYAERVVKTVTENCRTLKSRSFGFENQ